MTPDMTNIISVGSEPHNDLRKLPAEDRSWAQTVPVSRLPDDLVVEILDDVHACLRWSTSDYRHMWITVLNVCRHWREVAYATPWLWRIIDVYRRPEWLVLCLLRAAGARTHISFYHALFPPDQIRPLLSPYLSTIGSLSFDLGLTKDSGPWGPSVLRVLSDSVAMTSLSRLRLELHSAHDTPRLALPPLHFPALDSLDLRFLNADHLRNDIIFKYRTLRKLTLAYCTWVTSIADLLDVLEALAMLERIELKHPFSRTPSDLIEFAGSQRPPILLPRLHTFILLDYDTNVASYFSPILECLRLQAATTVKLSKVGARSIPRLLPPTMSATFPMLASTTSLHLQLLWQEHELSACDERGHPVVRLSWRNADGLPWMDGIVANAIALCSRAPVASFVVMIHWVTAFDADEWLPLWRAFPLLQRLEFKFLTSAAVRHRSWEGFHDALRPVYTNGILPNLKVVKIVIVNNAVTLSDDILEFMKPLRVILNDCGDRGGHLEDLILDIGRPQLERDGYVEQRERCLRDLRSVAGNVNVTFTSI